MPSLNNLRPFGDRHSKPSSSPLPQHFVAEQQHLADCRDKFVTIYQLFDHSHIAPWDDLWQMVNTVNDLLSVANLACIFGVCADACNVAAATAQPVPAKLLNDLWTLGVMVGFISRAQQDETQARQWCARADCFNTNPTAPLKEILDEAIRRQVRLEPSIVGQLLWLKTDAVSFFPDPGQPEKGWRDAYTFLWGYQCLSPATHDQFNPCQLLIARLQPLPPIATTQTVAKTGT